MKKLLSPAVKLFFQTVLASVMCFIIYMSFSFIFVSIGTHVIGYQVYEIDSNNNRIYGETVTFDEGEEIAFPEDGKYITIRSEQTKFVKNLQFVLSQSIMFALFVSFVNARISKLAYSDRTAVMYQGQKKCLYKGFLVGSIASLPSFAFYVYLVIYKLIEGSVSVLTLERILNCSFMPLINHIVDNAQKLSQISYGQLAALSFQFLVLPIVAGICYLLNYNRLNIKEKIIYKNNGEN